MTVRSSADTNVDRSGGVNGFGPPSVSPIPVIHASNCGWPASFRSNYPKTGVHLGQRRRRPLDRSRGERHVSSNHDRTCRKARNDPIVDSVRRGGNDNPLNHRIAWRLNVRIGNHEHLQPVPLSNFVNFGLYRTGIRIDINDDGPLNNEMTNFRTRVIVRSGKSSQPTTGSIQRNIQMRRRPEAY
jgi:hypothetical protein